MLAQESENVSQPATLGSWVLVLETHSQAMKEEQTDPTALPNL